MLNTYFETRACIDRLLRQYKDHPRLIIAIDFDDTIFDINFSGKPSQTILNIIKRCQKHNFYITIYTAREAKDFFFIAEYMSLQGIIIDSINANPIPLQHGNSGKMYYNLLLDDKAGLGQAYLILDTLLAQLEINNYVNKS